MEGADFFSRFIADGAVAVGGGAATLIAASGLAQSIAYNGVGDYTITLRQPGVLKLGVQDPDAGDINVPITFFQLQGGRGFVDYTYPTPTTLHVLVTDPTGTPADFNGFQFLVKNTQRRLVP